METKDYKHVPTRRAGAADLCRQFMENEGWAQVFALARGEPQTMLVSKRNRLTGAVKTVQVKVTPDADQRLAAYKLVTSYGYGRPSEIGDPDTGRSVTDMLVEALRPARDNEARPR